MHIVYAISPGGGPEAYVRTLAPWLVARGHRVSVVSNLPFATTFPGSVYMARPTLAHDFLERLVRGFRAWPLRLRAWEQAAAIARAVQRIDAAQAVDVVEVIEGLPLQQLSSRWPVVVRAHGAGWSFRHFCRDRNRRYDQHLIRLEASQLRQAAAVAAISRQLADHLAEFCEFSRERIRVIAGAINVTEFSTRAQPEATQSSADGPRILSVGRLEARKGTDTLIRAMSRVWHTFPDARLCLPGRGQFTPGELLALAPAAKRAQILFPGYVAHAQLSAYYQSASLYVTATRYETFAYTVLEAMASSLPVIASRTGAIPELIEDGQNGVLSPVDDPRALGETMTGLLSDRARMARLGVAARESAQQFAPARLGPQHEAFYASAVEAHAHRAR